MKQKIYISGAISSEYTIERAAAKFATAATRLQEEGYSTINPFDNGLTEEHSWEEHLAADIIMLEKADAIFMLPCWEDSTGARLEYEYAKLKGKRIMYDTRVNC